MIILKKKKLIKGIFDFPSKKEIKIVLHSFLFFSFIRLFEILYSSYETLRNTFLCSSFVNKWIKSSKKKKKDKKKAGGGRFY
jgi:hypothetical protein